MRVKIDTVSGGTLVLGQNSKGYHLTLRHTPGNGICIGLQYLTVHGVTGWLDRLMHLEEIAPQDVEELLGVWVGSQLPTPPPAGGELVNTIDGWQWQTAEGDISPL